MQETILTLNSVCKSFGPVDVLKGINLTLKKGEIVGLVGENGAGKSTLMNVLGGVYHRTSGEVDLCNECYFPKKPDDAIRAGIAFIHQELNLFTNLTVAENIFIDNVKESAGGYFSKNKIRNKSKQLLERMSLQVDPDALVESLPMGMRQMIEIAKALSKNAKIIFFDEPTTSLSASEKNTLFRIIRELSSAGISMIYISHALDDVLNICHSILVIRDGCVVGEQKPVSQVTKESIIKSMVGREMGQLFPYIKRNIGDELLRIEKFSSGSRFRNVDIHLYSGEIVGLFGLMGAGRSELAKAIYGVDPYDGGKVYFMGNQENTLSPRKWIEKGLAFITENRRDEGLLLAKSVRENLVLANLKALRRLLGYLDRKQESIDSDAMINRLNIKTYDKNRQFVRLLSGGNQQKVVIGKWLLTKPKVFIIDEPTRGVDVGAKYEIYMHINSLAKDGSAVLFISSEMEELMGVCDRILVMGGGEIKGELTRDKFSQDRLIELAIEGA